LAALIKGTLSKIESAIAEIQEADGKEKAELAALPESRMDDARSVAHFTEAAAHEVTRANRSTELKNLSISGMAISIKGFEVSHPRMVEITSEICMMLARMGMRFRRWRPGKCPFVLGRNFPKGQKTYTDPGPFDRVNDMM